VPAKFQYLHTHIIFRVAFHCHHSIWNYLSSCLLAKNVDSKIHKTNIFPAILYECKAGKHMFDNFPLQNCIKEGDTLSPPLFNFPIEYAISKVQENQVGLKMNGSHQLLACADGANPLRDNMNTTKKNTEVSTDDREVVSTETT
jgi:hypothetical protein